jgi:hypothetical protein
MTEGEKMVWAASFAERCFQGGITKRGSMEWGVLKAFEAVQMMRLAAQEARPQNSGGAEALAMLKEMLS